MDYHFPAWVTEALSDGVDKSTPVLQRSLYRYTPTQDGGFTLKPSRYALAMRLLHGKDASKWLHFIPKPRPKS